MQGVMSHSINWDLLEDQYLSDGTYREKLSKMVTIVDEAFVAGKKFAQTYSQTMDEQTEDPVIKSVNLEPTYPVDVTYKENVISIEKTKLPNIDVESFAQKENLLEKLKVLLKEKEISQSLYDKLTSNKKFELDSQDIEIINKLTEEGIKEVLLKCQIGKLPKTL